MQESKPQKQKNRQKQIAEMNKIDNRKKQIKREINLFQGRAEQFKKRQRLLEQSKRQISICMIGLSNLEKERDYQKRG